MKKVLLAAAFLVAVFAVSAQDTEATSIPSCGTQDMYWSGTRCSPVLLCTMQYPSNCNPAPCEPGFTSVAGQRYCYQPNPNPANPCQYQVGTYWDGTQCVQVPYCSSAYSGYTTCNSHPCATGYVYNASTNSCVPIPVTCGNQNPYATSCLPDQSTMCHYQVNSYWDGTQCKQMVYCTMIYPSTCTANPCAPGYVHIANQNDCVQQTPPVPPYYQSRICQNTNTYWNGTNCVSILYCSGFAQCDSYPCISGYVHGTANVDCVQVQNPVNQWRQCPDGTYVLSNQNCPTVTNPWTPHQPCLYSMWSACGGQSPDVWYPTYTHLEYTYPTYTSPTPYSVWH
jgi:hypothetical protein